WQKLDRWRSDRAGLCSDDWRIVESSGVTAFHPAVRLPSSDPQGSAARWLTGWRRIAEYHPRRLRLILRPEDLAPSARVALRLGTQAPYHLRTPADVRRFAQLGQRVSQLTYNGVNHIGSGCYARRDFGLTAAGAEIVGAMNQAGMA